MLSCRLEGISNFIHDYDMYVLIKWSFKPLYFLYVHLVVKRPIKISRQAKSIRLCHHNLCDGIGFVHLTNSSLCFTSIVIILPMEERGHLLECWTRTCEYNYDLKLCTFNVGEKDKSGVLGMLVHDALEVLLAMGL